jgi:hypothetical protein
MAVGRAIIHAIGGKAAAGRASSETGKTGDGLGIDFFLGIDSKRSLEQPIGLMEPNNRGHKSMWQPWRVAFKKPRKSEAGAKAERRSAKLGTVSRI